MISHVLVWAYAAVLALPLYYLFVSSFKTNTEIFADGFGLPTTWSFDNYRAAWENVSLGSALRNSVVITLAAEILTIVVVVPAAYAIARSRGRVAKLVERSMALGFLIPGFAAMVPTVMLAVFLDLYQTRTFLVLNYVGTAVPLSVLLLSQYMRAIPPELDESAALDGAGRLQTLWRIYVPLAMPAIATVSILNFIAIWNEYLVALVVAGPSVDVRTVQVALPTLVTNVAAQYGVLTAGTIVTLIPVYIAYVLLRRRMESALVSGALKS